MFARIVSGQTAPEGFDGLVEYAESQLPDSEAKQGFEGFLLLTDRQTGNLLTISLWATPEDLKRVEAEAAQLHSGAVESVDVEVEPVQVFAVEIARLP